MDKKNESTITYYELKLEQSNAQYAMLNNALNAQ